MSALCCLSCQHDTDVNDYERESLLPTRESSFQPTYSASIRSSSGYERVGDVVGAPIDRKWYHGGINLREAEYRMRSCDPKIRRDGTYLVYDNPRRRGEYVLLVYHKNELRRWKIIRRERDGKYVLGEDSPGAVAHTSVRKLIEYHRGITGKPIKLEHGGSLKLSDYVYQE